MNIHQTLKQLVENERHCTFLVLKKLNELDFAKTYAELGHHSLFEYCVQELKYSADQACRRIASARLLNSLPEITSKVESGNLNLSHLSKASTLFNHVQMPKEEKLNLLESIVGLSNRESEKIMRAIDPIKTPIVEKIKPVCADLSEVKFYANDELLEKIEKVKQLLNKEKVEDIINKMCDKIISANQKENKKEIILSVQGKNKNTRYVPVSTKCQIRIKANMQCEFVGVNGKRCICKTNLEFAHRTPFAHGGTTEASNLMLLCQTHNAVDAIHVFGVLKMRKFYN
jgi:hypothetical protein